MLKIKKLSNKKGSVLFIVLSMMTVLIILASAVYYSVMSARKNVETQYNEKQAYQTALSVDGIINSYISASNKDNAFVTAITELEPGSDTVLYTKGTADGYSDLGSGLGEYKITIKKLSGESTSETQIVEFTTEINVNGTISTVTSVGEIKVTNHPYSFDRFFTSTGYAPNDVYMSGMKIGSTIYLDNEYSIVGNPDGSNTGINIESEVIAAGTLSMYNAPMYPTEAVDFTVGNNLYLFFAGNPMYRKGGNLRVGANLLVKAGSRFEQTTGYVVGDYITGGNGSDGDSPIYVNGDGAFFYNCNYLSPVYINGDFYMDKKVTEGSSMFKKLTVGGEAYVANTAQKNLVKGWGVPEDKIHIYDSSSYSFIMDDKNQYDTVRATLDNIRTSVGKTESYSYIWPTGIDATNESYTEVLLAINDKLGTPAYINWNVTKKFTDPENTPTVINYTSTYEKKQETFKATSNTTYFKVGDISSNIWTASIKFDTEIEGEPGKYGTIYVYLPANCTEIKSDSGTKYTTDAPDTYNAFRWNNSSDPNNSIPMHVLVKGKGSVVFVLAEGAKYVAQNQSFVGHIGLFKELGNSESSSGGAEVLDDVAATNLFYQNDADHTKFTYKDGIIEKYGETGTKEYIHNNIFLVAIDQNAEMDFQKMQNLFGGFIYAPYMTFYASKDGVAGTVGGMIVSDYTMYDTSNKYVCTVPYDYYGLYKDADDYDPAKYLEYIMLESGSSTPIYASSSRSWKVYGYN